MRYAPVKRKMTDSQDTDTPAEMYIESVEVYEWDDFYDTFGYVPGDEDDEDFENDY